MAIPTTGRNTTRVSPHESNQFIGREPLRSVRDPQEDAEQRHPGEHDECVPLQTPGLDCARGAPPASPVPTARPLTMPSTPRWSMMS